MSLLITACSEIRKLYKQLTVEGAYERYIEHAKNHHPESQILPYEQFFLYHQEHRWNGVNRCC